MATLYRTKTGEKLSDVVNALFEEAGCGYNFLKFQYLGPSLEELIYNINFGADSPYIDFIAAHKYLPPDALIILPKFIKIDATISLKDFLEAEKLENPKKKVLTEEERLKKITVLNRNMTTPSLQRDDLALLPIDLEWEINAETKEKTLMCTLYRDCFLWDVAIEKYNEPLMDKQIAKLNQLNHISKYPEGKKIKLFAGKEFHLDPKDIEMRKKLKTLVSSLLSPSLPESASVQQKKERIAFICSKIFADHDIEGYYSYMYKDTNNIVTIGIGTNIGDVALIEDKKLTLYLCDSDHKRDIHHNCMEKEHHEIADFETIKKFHANVKAQGYKKRNSKGQEYAKTAGEYFEANKLELDSTGSKGSEKAKNTKTIHFLKADAEKAAVEHIKIKCFQLTIEKFFTNYDTYPLPALIGLVDLIYNVGQGSGVVNKFPSFSEAVKAKNWKKAAQESHRDENQGAGLRKRSILDYESFMMAYQASLMNSTDAEITQAAPEICRITPDANKFISELIKPATPNRCNIGDVL